MRMVDILLLLDSSTFCQLLSSSSSFIVCLCNTVLLLDHTQESSGLNKGFKLVSQSNSCQECAHFLGSRKYAAMAYNSISLSPDMTDMKTLLQCLKASCYFQGPLKQLAPLLLQGPSFSVDMILVASACRLGVATARSLAIALLAHSDRLCTNESFCNAVYTKLSVFVFSKLFFFRSKPWHRKQSLNHLELFPCEGEKDLYNHT